MKRLVVCLAASLAFAATAKADEVIKWNNVLLDTIRAVGGPPCPLSRTGAMMHTAIYDAVNSIDKTHEKYFISLPASAEASREAAVAAAAHRVLTNLYPARQAIYDAELAATLSAIPDSPGKSEGQALGVAVADAIMAHRANDRTSPEPVYVIGTRPGDWRPTFPDYTSPPFNPGWGNSEPWTMITGSQFRPKGPLNKKSLNGLLHSRGYADQVNELKAFGGRNSTVRTAEQTLTAWFWANDRNGTYKPPGHLNHITQVVSEDHHLTLSQNARLFALINIAMADAGLVAWDAKYNTGIDLWRPISAIRLADTDGNNKTVADPTWEPLNDFTPPFPAYISGHATFGAVHAAIMADFFGTDDITFTTNTDEPGYTGVYRTYHSFSEAAHENGRSRIYLGVHYPFDAEDGYLCGTALGHHVYATQLRPLGSVEVGHAAVAGSSLQAGE